LKYWIGDKQRKNYVLDLNEISGFSVSYRRPSAGGKFYDRQEAGVGDCFFDSLFAEIDSLVILKNTQGKTCSLLFL